MSIPRVGELGNSFTFTWEQEKVTGRVERVYQHSRGEVSAEITFRTTLHDPPALLHHSRCSNLLGTRSRKEIARDCAEKYPSLRETDWLALVETCFEHVVSRARQGEPPELIIDVEMDESSDFLLHPLLHSGDITVLFGLGGSLKSTLSAWLSIRVALGIDADATNVAILDWESTSRAWARRIREVSVGIGESDPPPNIVYRRMHQPIADDIEAVYNLGTDMSVGLWIIDSAMWACGGRPEEAEHAMAMFRAVRSLGGTTLIIAHQNNDENTKRPYGNVMWVNAPRSVIQVQRSTLSLEENEVVVGLTQRKVNYGRPFPPTAFRARFNQAADDAYTSGDMVTIESTNPLDNDDLAENVSLPHRIRHLLAKGRLNRADIPEAMDVHDARKVKVVLSTVDRMVRSGHLQRLTDGHVGLAAGTFPTGVGNNVSHESNVVAFPQGG